MAKKKLFGKLNIIDVFIIIVLIGVVAGTVYRFTSPGADLTRGQTVIDYTIRIQAARAFSLEYYDVGHIVFDSITEEEIGFITGFWHVPHRAPTFHDDGTVTLEEMPGLVDIYVNIRTTGLVTAEAYFSGGTYELKVGSNVPFMTKWMNVVTTTITSVSAA